MRIGELAEKLGFSSDLLRRLEREKILPPARRDRSGQRRFSPQDARRIRRILMAPKNGRPNSA